MPLRMRNGIPKKIITPCISVRLKKCSQNRTNETSPFLPHRKSRHWKTGESVSSKPGLLPSHPHTVKTYRQRPPVKWKPLSGFCPFAKRGSVNRHFGRNQLLPRMTLPVSVLLPWQMKTKISVSWINLRVCRCILLSTTTKTLWQTVLPGILRSRTFPYVCRFINRLDRDTTGLLIAAKHALSASILSGTVKKAGNPPGISGSCQRKDSGVRHHLRSHRPPARLCLKAVRGLFAWRKSRHPLYYPGLPAGSIRKWVLPDFSLSRNRAHPSDTCSYEFYWTSASWRFSLLPG